MALSAPKGTSPSRNAIGRSFIARAISAPIGSSPGPVSRTAWSRRLAASASATAAKRAGGQSFDAPYAAPGTIASSGRPASRPRAARSFSACASSSGAVNTSGRWSRAPAQPRYSSRLE